MTKINSGWKPTMERWAEREDRQVKCLIASGGHLWMKEFRPPAVGGTSPTGHVPPQHGPLCQFQ